MNLGDIAIEQGRLDDGRALLEEALDCSEGATSNAALVALINLSEIAALQGRYRDAASLGRTALATALDHGDQLRAVWATFQIAWALAELGELERCRTAHRSRNDIPPKRRLRKEPIGPTVREGCP